MDITNINLAACPLQYLSVGYVGETGARPVAFDFSAWAEEYGAGVLQMLMQRPGDAEPYPVLLDIDGTTATWTPDETDTAAQGQGQAQLVYTVGGVVVKNAIFRVLIAPSLGAAGNPPEPYEDWLERLLTIAAEAQQSAIDAAGSAEAAGTSAGAAAGSAGAAAQSALDAEAAKTGAEAAATAAGNSAALARGKAAEAAQAAQTAVENADYSETQRIAAESAAVLAADSVERSEAAADGANQAKTDAQSAASAAAASEASAGAAAADAAATVTEVETKGAEQITAINQAGTTQIAAVDAAGAVQVQAIEDKGEEVVASIPSDYTELVDEVSDLKSSINDIHQIPEGGTSGQILTKKSGSDYDVEWSPVGMPSDAQVDSAVTDWLNDHPEATTTVQDGAITMPKLNSSLQDTVVVQLETEEATFHNVTPKSVSFYPDSRINTVTAKYTNSKNMVGGEYPQGVQNGITRTVAGNMLMLTGTGTDQVELVRFTNEEKIANFKGKTFNVYVYIQKSTAWELGNYFQLYDGVGTPLRQWLSKGTTTMIGWTEFKNVSINENATIIQIKFTNATDNVFAEGDFIWIGMYETELIDTDQTVTGENPYTIAISGFNCVDTAMHNSVAKYIEPTKDYVDNHIPDIKAYWTNEIYALPEKFGAVGDGVADDYQAIMDCIAYAAANKKSIRGYGTYKTSGTIVLNARYADVYLRDIVYTGSSDAVSIENENIVFEFNSINSTGIGMSFGGSNPYARRCQVKGNSITSNGHCININDLALYCTLDIRVLSSINGNCINRNRVSTWGGGEFVFRSSSCACPNGYVSYNNGSDKFYDFTVEANCKYGLLNPSGCLCVGWRHREQVDGMRRHVIEQNPAYNNGALITFTQQPNGEGHDAFRYISSDDIPWHSIDLSACEGYDTIPVGTDSVEEWFRLAYTGIDIGATIRGAGAVGHTVFGSRTFFVGGHLVCVPEGRNICELAQAEYDMTLFDSSDPIDIRAATSFELAKAWATDFVTEYAHTDLYLNASFGAIGYNDLTLTQKDGNTCKIYDKLGNVLFDGTNEGDGKWSLKCFIDRSSMGRYEGTTDWWCYDGTNEKWEVTKID